MSLFRRNGKPLKFHLVGIDKDEVIALKKLIDDGGGEVTDDEETLVKFTSPDTSRTRSYTRAKIYDVAYIVESFKAKRFVEPEKYRLGKKIPGDEFIMLHFLYGDCNCVCKEIASKGNSQQGSIFPSQSNDSGRLVMTGSSDFFATAESLNTDEDRSQSTEMNMAKLNPPLTAAHPHRDMSFFFDESQTVVDGLELAMILQSSLASGDVAENVNANVENGPCNLEYERDIGPKMVVLADEVRRLIRSREKLSVRKGPQPQRSSRTVARKNVVENVATVKQEVPSDVEHTESFFSPSEDQDDCSIQVIDVETEASKTAVEVIQINDSPLSCSSTNSEMSNKATYSISTKKSAAKKTTNDRMNSKVGNIQYKATSNGEKLSKSTEKSNLPERTEHKGTRKISEDKNMRNKKTMEKTHSEGISESKSDTEARLPRLLTNNSRKQKSTGRRLPLLRKTFHDQIYGFSGSSSFSSDDEPSKSKKSRNRVSLSDSSDEVVIIDGDSDKKSQPHKRQRSEEAGPSGVRRERQNPTDDDESSGTETHSHQHETQMEIHANKSVPSEKSSGDKLPNGTERSQDNVSQNEKSQPQRRKRSDETGSSNFRNEAQTFTSDDESAEEETQEELKPKIEPGVRRRLSRGAMWRANLLNKVQRNLQYPYRKAFSPSERLKMLRYLIKRNAIHMAKGLIIWSQMIDDGYLTHRTPQSLQNHFLKHILPNIRSIDTNIKSADMNKFLALKGEK